MITDDKRKANDNGPVPAPRPLRADPGRERYTPVASPGCPITKSNLGRKTQVPEWMSFSLRVACLNRQPLAVDLDAMTLNRIPIREIGVTFKESFEFLQASRGREHTVVPRSGPPNTLQAGASAPHAPASPQPRWARRRRTFDPQLPAHPNADGLVDRCAHG